MNFSDKVERKKSLICLIKNTQCLTCINRNSLILYYCFRTKAPDYSTKIFYFISFLKIKMNKNTGIIALIIFAN